MKKQLIFTAAFAAAFALAGLNKVSAATGNTEATSSTNATFNISDDGLADTKGDLLYLTSAPSFDFGTANLGDVITKGSTLNGKATGDLTVKDFTGTSAGWHVDASLTSFTNGDDSIDGTLNYTQSTPSGNNVEGAALKDTPVTLSSNGSATALAVPAKFGQGNTDSSAKDATLNFNADPSAKKGTYTAAITWSVTAGTPATDASGQTTQP
jgi:hypothetical protein